MGDFTHGSKKRIAQIVKRVEQTPRNNVGNPSLRRPSMPNRKIWAKISGSSEVSSKFRHSWTEQIRSGDTFIDKPSGLTGTTGDNYAVAPDGTEVATTTVVQITLSFVSDVAFWTIDTGGAAGVTSGYDFVTRVVLNPTTLSYFKRTVTITKGRITAVSAESEVIIDTMSNCGG